MKRTAPALALLLVVALTGCDLLADPEPEPFVLDISAPSTVDRNGPYCVVPLTATATGGDPEQDEEYAHWEAGERLVSGGGQDRRTTMDREGIKEFWSAPWDGPNMPSVIRTGQTQTASATIEHVDAPYTVTYTFDYTVGWSGAFLDEIETQTLTVECR